MNSTEEEITRPLFQVQSLVDESRFWKDKYEVAMRSKENIQKYIDMRDVLQKKNDELKAIITRRDAKLARIAEKQKRKMLKNKYKRRPKRVVCMRCLSTRVLF